MENRLLYYSLTLSLFIHLSLVAYFSSQKIKDLHKPLKQMEVVYHIHDLSKVRKKEMEVGKIEIVKQEELLTSKELFKNDTSFFSPIKEHFQDISKFASGFKLEKARPTSIKEMDSKHKISIPHLKSEKISNPKYLSYNDTIRQRIKQRAYRYIDDVNFNSGQVYLTFALNADGNLKQVKIIEHRTKADNHLRDVGLRSIKDSNPFPPFPKGLSFPELTFNVIISFEVR